MAIDNFSYTDKAFDPTRSSYPWWDRDFSDNNSSEKTAAKKNGAAREGKDAKVKSKSGAGAQSAKSEETGTTREGAAREGTAGKAGGGNGSSNTSAWFGFIFGGAAAWFDYSYSSKLIANSPVFNYYTVPGFNYNIQTNFGSYPQWTQPSFVKPSLVRPSLPTPWNPLGYGGGAGTIGNGGAGYGMPGGLWKQRGILNNFTGWAFSGGGAAPGLG